MNRYNLTWSDVGKALLILLIGNLLALVMGLPDDQLPTWAMIKSNLITSVKFGFIPYIVKNFFSDDVKAAVKTLAKADELEEKKALKNQQ